VNRKASASNARCNGSEHERILGCMMNEGRTYLGLRFPYLFLVLSEFNTLFIYLKTETLVYDE
jgi:hypothetical protein